MVRFVKLKGKLILAPMADVTNLAFRLMCKKYGASLVSTELLSANAISKNNKAVMKLGLTDKKEKPNVVQLFSQNSENLVKAAKKIEGVFEVIDLNFGCPSVKVMKQGGGGALLKRKNKIAEIVKAVSSAVKIPVSVKIRSGFDLGNINAVEVARICEKNGASAVNVHARTVEQGYSGKANWDVIKKVKDAVKIPVIGNGDVVDGESAERMLKETACDYVMVGRGAIGNPFIFKQINEFLKTGKVIEQSRKERIKDYFEYIELAKKFNVFSILDARKKAQDFTKGFDGSSRLRARLNRVKDWADVKALMKRFI